MSFRVKLFKEAQSRSAKLLAASTLGAQKFILASNYNKSSNFLFVKCLTAVSQRRKFASKIRLINVFLSHDEAFRCDAVFYEFVIFIILEAFSKDFVD